MNMRPADGFARKPMLAIFPMLNLLLTGCFSNIEPIYIARIEVYQNSNLLNGTLRYHDGSEWLDYDPNITDKTIVYYSVDVISNSFIDIGFDIYSPDAEIDDMKLTLSDDFGLGTGIGAWATIGEREEDIVKSSYKIASLSSSYNVIEIYGWLTDDGPKYIGAKAEHVNYVLRGVYLNLPS